MPSNVGQFGLGVLEAPRLTPRPSIGLSTLEALKKQHACDLRRAGASIALTNSITQSIENKSAGLKSRPTTAPNTDNTPVERKTSTVDASVQLRRKSMRGMEFEARQALEAAFRAHAAVIDDREVTISVEELIKILDRCGLIDEDKEIGQPPDELARTSGSGQTDGSSPVDRKALTGRLTANRIRFLFQTWSQGCNSIVLGPQVNTPTIEVGFKEFENVLRWGADLNETTFKHFSAKITRAARRLVDTRSSARARLSVIFKTFCRQYSDHMTTFEFSLLCSKLRVYQTDMFTRADVFYLMFYTPGYDSDKGAIDFDGFMNVLVQVGGLLGVSEEAVFGIFAQATEILENDEEIAQLLNKLKYRIKWAAASADGVMWQNFFYEADTDNSGTINWCLRILCPHIRVHPAAGSCVCIWLRGRVLRNVSDQAAAHRERQSLARLVFEA
eukprot:gnl/TRDRNA2_/TRDRNA2_87494_c0_seq2.p1 gnl/TRDRNA2_/TRDRNA2_87494_c0~~gnl/TRDRNA2_/TRDRNA2_87494_c0_seq2.p1  ORF type:complete len:456 (+),score=60.35 gnl/TRDRNA2_/TRDRNA2_87494_c0_seq2:39-1370(+)